MNDARRTLIRYRLTMARETLEDARVLRREGRSPWSVVNRAYYAMFYAVLALSFFWEGIRQGTPSSWPFLMSTSAYSFGDKPVASQGLWPAPACGLPGTGGSPPGAGRWGGRRLSWSRCPRSRWGHPLFPFEPGRHMHIAVKVVDFKG